MKKSLWNVFDGEPFMENPQLGILSLTNRPKRRRKRGFKMAVRRKRRTTRRRRGRKTAAPRVHRRVRRRSPVRRRRRRNWATSGAVVPMNPRRRRSRRRNPVRRHRRHHRNPFGISGFPPVKHVLFAGLGFAGPSLVSGFLSSTFPTVMQQTTSLGVAGKYLVKIGSILGLAWLTKRFVGHSEAQMVMLGGGANVALSLVNDFVPGYLPANPLGMYLPTVLPPMMTNAGAGGMRSYVGLRGMRATPGTPFMPGGYASTAAVFPAIGTARPSGAYGGTAARFKRF